MRCPKCGHEWKDEGRSKGGRLSRRKPGARCQVHGCFIRSDGKCRRCERDRTGSENDQAQFRA